MRMRSRELLTFQANVEKSSDDRKRCFRNIYFKGITNESPLSLSLVSEC
jgi:hypothetical protein